jgi:hypothetical protein
MELLEPEAVLRRQTLYPTELRAHPIEKTDYAAFSALPIVTSVVTTAIIGFGT